MASPSDPNRAALLRLSCTESDAEAAEPCFRFRILDDSGRVTRNSYLIRVREGLPTTRPECSFSIPTTIFSGLWLVIKGETVAARCLGQF